MYLKAGVYLSIWQNDFTCADYLRECGEKFIAADHYAVDCIRPKCCELQRICDEFNERLSHRRRSLEISHKLHQHIDKVPLSSVFSYWHQLCMAWAHKTLLLAAVEFTVSKLTIWCPLLPKHYVAHWVKPSFVIVVHARNEWVNEWQSRQWQFIMTVMW